MISHSGRRKIRNHQPETRPWAFDEQVPVGGYGDDQHLRYLVMTRLGSDIQAAKEKNKAWQLSRTVGYARQMFGLLRALHERCRLVFVDVKPGEPHRGLAMG